MSVAGYNDLLMHVGHDIEIATYGTFPAAYGPEDAERVRASNPMNVAIECLDCSEVLLDYDAPEVERWPGYTPEAQAYEMQLRAEGAL